MANRVKINDLEINIGDIVRVHQKIQEGGKIRTQPFEGMVVAFKNGGENTMFTVRKLSAGIGVERIWPLNSPWIDKIEIKKKGSARRSKLYYFRKRADK
jgi:large subunit ribosomal protein L19